MFLLPMVPDTELVSLEAQTTQGVFRAPVDWVGLPSGLAGESGEGRAIWVQPGSTIMSPARSESFFVTPIGGVMQAGVVWGEGVRWGLVGSGAVYGGHSGSEEAAGERATLVWNEVGGWAAGLRLGAGWSIGGAQGAKQRGVGLSIQSEGDGWTAEPDGLLSGSALAEVSELVTEGGEGVYAQTGSYQERRWSAGAVYGGGAAGRRWQVGLGYGSARKAVEATIWDDEQRVKLVSYASRPDPWGNLHYLVPTQVMERSRGRLEVRERAELLLGLPYQGELAVEVGEEREVWQEIAGWSGAGAAEGEALYLSGEAGAPLRVGGGVSLGVSGEYAAWTERDPSVDQEQGSQEREVRAAVGLPVALEAAATERLELRASFLPSVSRISTLYGQDIAEGQSSSSRSSMIVSSVAWRAGLSWAPGPAAALDLAAGGGATLSLSSIQGQLRLSW